ncbi:MAG: AMP-binding protein [Actinobacteria bacterium]|nr:AMP-binding protein [Actinomycetota bacterium]
MAEHGIFDLADLRRRSVDDPEWFWDAFVRFAGIEFSTPYTAVLDTSRGIEWATWFDGGRMNAAKSCVDKWAQRADGRDRVAVSWEGEEGEVRSLTFARLQELTDRIAHGLAARGIGEGDAVGVFLPMLPETVATVMAIAKLGAIFLPVFSGYGAEAVAIRLRDGGAKALVTADGTTRRGRLVPMKETADEAAAMTPGIETVVVVPRLGRADVAMTAGRDLTLDQLTALGPGIPFPTRALDAEHPLFVAYTSGTTGRPKGAVHVHAGFLVKIAEEAGFQADCRRGDVLFWLTDLGWIMGPWQIFGTLAWGATVFCYDGAPDHPGPDRLWSMVERHRITILGVSPTLVRSLLVHGDDLVTGRDLSSLRVLCSTGEPWNEGPWQWYFDVVGAGRCPVINVSGGTEVGCFLAPHPVEEIAPCSLGGPALGCAVDVVDDECRPVRGVVGELVCRAPWPAMTRGMWNDPDRYLETYWSRWPGVWWHGDWASIDENGQWYLHGRSDDTIKLAGKRLGPAEVETVLVEHPAVVEAAAVGLPDALKGEALACYVVLAPGAIADDVLRAELGGLVADRLGKSFRPSAVRFTSVLPKTRSNKVMRRAIRAVALGEEPGDLSGLEDPAALEAIAGAR